RFANVLVAQGVQDGVERREIGVNVSQQCEDLGAWRASSGSGRRCDRRDAGIAGCDLTLGQCQYAAQSLREDSCGMLIAELSEDARAQALAQPTCRLCVQGIELADPDAQHLREAGEPVPVVCLIVQV